MKPLIIRGKVVEMRFKDAVYVTKNGKQKRVAALCQCGTEPYHIELDKKLLYGEFMGFVLPEAVWHEVVHIFFPRMRHKKVMALTEAIFLAAVWCGQFMKDGCLKEGQ